ncbi:MAG: hypothetical protein HOV97_05840 [Nonomuraea sp.]|nr:hypothetical protein [Nonomuraea sp.]
MTTMSSATTMANYTDAIANLPQEAFLGSLLYFSISMADVNLENARRDLEAVGLSTATLRKNLRPVDAFRKATREFAKKFSVQNEIRSELLVRPAGEDNEQAYIHLILERVAMQKGKKRRIFYERVGELTFTRGFKKDGEYVSHGVEARRTTSHLQDPLTAEEDQWLTERLITFEDRYDHMLRYMDSHAVRTFVREYIYELSGTCVKESGGLYFVKQDHADTIAKLQSWVKSIDSEFHALPLLNLTDQREMILEAFEDETVKEVDRLVGELKKILDDPDRQIEEKTFDAYALRAAELSAKINEYNSMLGARADRAAIEVQGYTQQCMALASRIRQPKSLKAKTI